MSENINTKLKNKEITLHLRSASVGHKHVKQMIKMG